MGMPVVEAPSSLYAGHGFGDRRAGRCGSVDEVYVAPGDRIRADSSPGRKRVGGDDSTETAGSRGKRRSGTIDGGRDRRTTAQQGLAPCRPSASLESPTVRPTQQGMLLIVCRLKGIIRRYSRRL